MTALILYFSGTGNTQSVAQLFEKALLRQNISVVMHSIEDTFDISAIAYDHLIIGFPKYYENPMFFIQDYIKQNLPKRETTISTLAFCTQASPLSTDFSGLERLLKKKNHKLTVAKSFEFANNMMIFQSFTPTEASDLAAHKRLIQEQVEPLLSIYLSGKSSTERIKSWQKPLFYLVAAGCTKLMPVFAMRFSASDECIHCGLCARQCPVNNIRIVQGHPVYQKHCLFCMRCINACPTNAILYNKKGCQQYKCEPFE